MYLLNTWCIKDHESKCGEHSKCNKYNLMIKHPPFLADQFLDTKFKVIFLSMVKRPDQWRMIKELENISSYSVKSGGQAVKSQKHIQLCRNLFTARYMLIENVPLKISTGTS